MLHSVLAAPEDYDFIRKEVLSGIRQKHFLIPLKTQEDIRSVEEDIRMAILQHCFASGLRVLPLIFRKNHRRVGMVLMSEVSPGKGGNELHLMTVVKKHRGKGYGSNMLDLILEGRQEVDVFARCAPASSKMYEMLKKRGFEFQYASEDGFRVLMRARLNILSEIS